MPNWPNSSQLRGGFATAKVSMLLCGSTQSHTESAMCDLAAQHAAHNSDVPLELLMAISRVETGRGADGEIQPWPWAINQGGKSHWFDTADQAINYANGLLAQGGENFDAGCFQINLRWHSKNFGSLADMFDPETNATYAAAFLTSLFQSEGGWPQAVAAYHSRNPDQAQAYLTRVEAALNKLRANGTVPTDAGYVMASDAISTPRLNRFPLLRSGERGSAASLVPLTEGVMPLFESRP
ncbi:MAG: lytic transglycosylase domain-containing protein [Cypionkella sp.]|uniref:lytic transglycosylase domain-containing protein n=1 Tax=Cypionkella sp. TaxID=2811411 RepID=UPI002ABBF2A3|nr:lytic transglycosylase domain-containing protein [Cypionkella sp.]MDZ4311941.1 lytic transglycosylase domain-containing protein [Cypionkella sp.]